MQCDVTDHVQRHIYFLGVYEAIEASLFCRLLKPGDTVIDAGANVGQYSLLASTQVGPSGQVHAFEPVPRNFAALSRNVQLNNLSNVRLNQIALWNEPSELVFERPEEPDSNNGSFGAINPGNAASTNQTRVTVPAIPLDQYVEENQLASVDFIKMDIEGAEPFLLQGARRTLERFGPPILSEVRPDVLARLGSTVKDLEALLNDLGYHAWVISADSQEAGRLEHLSDLPDPNVLLYRGPEPPAGLTAAPLKTALRWARSGWSQRQPTPVVTPQAAPV